MCPQLRRILFHKQVEFSCASLLIRLKTILLFDALSECFCLFKVCFIWMSLLDAACNFQKSISVKPRTVKFPDNAKAFGFKFFSQFSMEFVVRLSCLTAGGEYECFFVGDRWYFVDEIQQFFVVVSK